jgi:hypothetical protein
MQAKFEAYVFACIKDGIWPLSYIAWANLMPLVEVEL